MLPRPHTGMARAETCTFNCVSHTARFRETFPYCCRSWGADQSTIILCTKWAAILSYVLNFQAFDGGRNHEQDEASSIAGTRGATAEGIMSSDGWSQAQDNHEWWYLARPIMAPIGCDLTERGCSYDTEGPPGTGKFPDDYRPTVSSSLLTELLYRLGFRILAWVFPSCMD